MSILYHTDMREFLEEKYELRLKKNPAYSLRAFGRDLGVCPSHLGKFLRGEKGLSIASTEKILSNFKLSTLQKKFLIAVVKREHSRSSEDRDHANSELHRIRGRSYRVVPNDDFAVMSDWHHMAILALSELSDFRLDIAWIAQRLGITEEATGMALARLTSRGILRRTAIGVEVDSATLANPTYATSESIQEFHRQTLELAERSIKSQTNETRELSTFFLSVKASQFLEARDFIREFREAFDRRFSMDVPKNERDAIYAFSMQYFKVADQRPSAESVNHEKSLA